VAELDTEAPADIVGNSRDPEKRREAIAELEQLGTLEPLEGDNDG